MSAPVRPMLAVSTTDDLVAEVQRIFVGAGDMTPVLFGERHLRQHDAPPLVIIALDKDGGTVHGPSKVSLERIAGITEKITCYIWGEETVDDGARYSAAKLLAMRVINALVMAAPGKLKKASLARPEASVDTFGEQYRVTALYTWDVPRDWTIWSVPVVPNSPADDMRPQGDAGTTFNLETTTQGTR